MGVYPISLWKETRLQERKLSRLGFASSTKTSKMFLSSDTWWLWRPPSATSALARGELPSGLLPRDVFMLVTKQSSQKEVDVKNDDSFAKPSGLFRCEEFPSFLEGKDWL